MHKDVDAFMLVHIMLFVIVVSCYGEKTLSFCLPSSVIKPRALFLVHAYVCMYVCMYVCKYVCIDGWMDELASIA